MVRIENVSGPEDVEAIRALFIEYQDSLDVDLCFQNFHRELDELPGDYAPPRGRLYLARIDGEAAACIALRPVDDDTCEMKRLYVRPAHRSTGIGRELVNLLIADARAIGYRRMALDTLPSMERAQRLYERLGFRDIPPYRENPVPGARYMGLDLGAER